jgi:hypothetical protein
VRIVTVPGSIELPSERSALSTADWHLALSNRPRNAILCQLHKQSSISVGSKGYNGAILFLGDINTGT